MAVVAVAAREVAMTREERLALWEGTVRERPDVASRFGPPAWLVAERLGKAPKDCSQVEIAEAVAELRTEYGLGEHPQQMVGQPRVPGRCGGCGASIPSADNFCSDECYLETRRARSGRVHPATHVEGACNFCSPTSRPTGTAPPTESLPQEGSPTTIPTPCPTCGTRPRDGRHRECYACRKRAQREKA